MKLKLALCSSVLLLGGCQLLLPKEGPVADTVRAMVQRPVSVELTEAQRKAFPYAAQYFQLGDGPRALVVLVRFSGSRSVYASSEARSLQLHAGRVVATTGFSTNFKFLDLPLAPSQALNTSEPLCWNSVWRASGQQIASNYRLSGCLTRIRTEPVVMPEGVVNLVRVSEQVTVSPTRQHYENIYWLMPETGQVVASVQRGGPLLPVMSFTRVVNEPASAPALPAHDLLPEPIAQDQRAPATVHVQHQGLLQGFAHRAANTTGLVASFHDRFNIDWQESALYRLDQQEVLQQQRDALVRDLNALADYWLAKRQRAQALSAQALAKEVQRWQLAHRVPAELDPQVLYLQPHKAIALKGQAYLLHLAEPRQDTPVFGVVFDHDLRWQGLQALDRLSDSRYLRPGANTTQAWLLKPSGQTLVVGLRPWNRRALEWEAGSRWFIGFDAAKLPAAWVDLNARLLALAPHRLP